MAEDAAKSRSDELWYFAYGANTSLAVLSGRRKIVPRSSEAATLTGHRLVFAMPGIPFFEPAFATVVPDPAQDARAEGVLHRLAAADMRRLDTFESRAYARVALDVVGRASGPVRAQVYVAKRPRHGLVPSRRYVELLLAGAREHELSAAHRAWLAAHPSVESRLARFLVARFEPAVRAIFRGD